MLCIECLGIRHGVGVHVSQAVLGLGTLAGHVCVWEGGPFLQIRVLLCPVLRHSTEAWGPCLQGWVRGRRSCKGMEAAPRDNAFSLSNLHQVVARPLLPLTCCLSLPSTAPDYRSSINAPPAALLRRCAA